MPADIIPFPTKHKTMSARGAALNARLQSKIEAKRQDTYLQFYAAYVAALERHCTERTQDSLEAKEEAKAALMDAHRGQDGGKTT